MSGEVEKYQRENEKLKKTVTELSAELKLVKVGIPFSSWNVLDLLIKQILIYLSLIWNFLSYEVKKRWSKDGHPKTHSTLKISICVVACFSVIFCYYNHISKK